MKMRVVLEIETLEQMAAIMMVCQDVGVEFNAAPIAAPRPKDLTVKWGHVKVIPPELRKVHKACQKHLPTTGLVWKALTRLVRKETGLTPQKIGHELKELVGIQVLTVSDGTQG